MRILFLSAYVGTGHTSAAEAVQKALLEIDPQITVSVVDSYAYSGRLLAKIAAQGYLQLVKVFPFAYSFVYDLPRRSAKITWLKSKLTQRVAKRFKKLIQEFKPDVVVCTHAFPSGIASILKEEFHFRTVGIVTDFTTHPFWIHSNTDLYLIGSPKMKSELYKFGIKSERIQATGIPIDPHFGVHEAKSSVRERLGLAPHLKTILLMGGGAGLGPMGSILRSLRKVIHPIQVLVITGANRGLRKKMEKIAQKINQTKLHSAIRDVRIYGYVDNVYDLMNAADLLISKPGGLTTSEALAAELPMVIVRPLPGQEIHNAQFLLQEQAGIRVKQVKKMAATVDQLLSHPGQLESLQIKARGLKKPKAAYDAARSILGLEKRDFWGN